MLIARLIAGNAGQHTGDLDAQLDAASKAIEAAGMKLALADMLDFCGDVLELSLPGGDARVLADIVETHFVPVDYLVSERAIAVPSVFVSDMDSTMIEQECIDELADFAGLKDKVSAITERAMLGELDFESALRERVGLLEGLGEEAIGRCLAERITPMPGARTLVATLKARGCRTVLVTGGFHHFADPVAAQLGFERTVGNRLGVADGHLTGQLAGAIVDSSVKERILREEMASLGEGALSLATGDGANDIPMLRAADFGIAYKAKPKARDAADGHIGHGDLTSVLKLLGIAQENWVVE
ncbi:phosphoserine phosphatase SerB [Alteripontixanthobacter maritimus]|nr:phosphoserine phosphatase SerB [Alteripontixanthobacter maritimus]